MRPKKIVKRGVKDTTWLYKFIKNGLNGLMMHSAPCTKKMYYVLSKYCRCLSYHESRYSTKTGLFYNDNKYAIEIREEGIKYKRNFVYIYDIKKCIKEKIEKRTSKYLFEIKKDQRKHNEKTSKQEQNDFIKFFELEETENFNPFQSNFTKTESDKIMKPFKDFGYLVDKYE